MCDSCASSSSPENGGGKRNRISGGGERKRKSRQTAQYLLLHTRVLLPREAKLAKYLYNTFVDQPLLLGIQPKIKFTAAELKEIYRWKSAIEEKWEAIIFDEDINPHRRRFQRLLWRNYEQTDLNDPRTISPCEDGGYQNALLTLPRCIVIVINAVFAWHGLGTLIVIKELWSKMNCGDQWEHMDCPGMSRITLKLPVYQAQFSGMLATEPNDNPTGLLIGSGKENVARKTQIIKQGKMMFWRGDFPHAGTNCTTKSNRRLFLSFGSHWYPLSNLVDRIMDTNDGEDGD